VFGLTYGDIDIKIATMKQVREWGKDRDLNPYGKRAPVWGGVIYNSPRIIYLFWLKSYQKHFTVYTLLQLLEHEFLHHVLDKVSKEARHQLDNIHKNMEVTIREGVVVYEFYFRILKALFYNDEEPPEDLLN
jgi:hypothetical protein